MAKGLRWTFRLFAGLILLVIVAGLGGYLWLRSSLPQTEGDIVLHGIAAAVSITRDDRGVPTIAAQSSNDAYFALGFVHAQDRLFQMDVMRRLGAGRLSEPTFVLGDAGLVAGFRRATPALAVAGLAARTLRKIPAELRPFDERLHRHQPRAIRQL